MNTFDELKSKFKNHFQHENILMINADCMDVLKECDDREFDLCLVDPPYGIGTGQIKNNKNRSKLAAAKEYKPYADNKCDRPKESYFKELKRIGFNQIIWGANHLCDLFDASGSGWIVWEKEAGGTFSDCELAYSSYKKSLKRFRYRWSGMLQGDHGDKRKNETRIHPSQKPVKLYQWIYENYCERDMSIIDTHLGSASNAIAAYYFGCKFVGVEIDKDYFDLSVKRIKEETKQVMLL